MIEDRQVVNVVQNTKCWILSARSTVTTESGLSTAMGAENPRTIWQLKAHSPLLKRMTSKDSKEANSDAGRHSFYKDKWALSLVSPRKNDEKFAMLIYEPSHQTACFQVSCSILYFPLEIMEEGGWESINNTKCNLS